MTAIKFNSSRYSIISVAEFHEVFDWQERETVFVSEKRHKAEFALAQLIKNGRIDKAMMEVK
jgi:hypothetical protein